MPAPRPLMPPCTSPVCPSAAFLPSSAERAASMYAAGPYSLALGLAEIPWLCAQSLVMVNITYW